MRNLFSCQEGLRQLFSYRAENNGVKTNGLVCTVKRTSVSNQPLSWAQLYEKRKRRFNLTVVFVALVAITWLSTVLWHLLMR